MPIYEFRRKPTLPEKWRVAREFFSRPINRLSHPVLRFDANDHHVEITRTTKTRYLFGFKVSNAFWLWRSISQALDRPGTARVDRNRRPND